MNAPVQSQLDDFARRLRALETELAGLRRQAAAAERVEPAPRPRESRRITSPELAQARSLVNSGDFRRALKQLERIGRHAVTTRNDNLLDEVLELARQISGVARGSRYAVATRLISATEQNLEFLKRMRGTREEQPPAPVQVQPVAVRRRVVRVPKFTAADLLGARALAIAGGCVTLLGILFFFILAVNRGWIGPTGRVGLGAIASAGVFVAGLWLRRRYGETHSALAAVAAGIAGGYGTLLAAAALYSLVPHATALVIAAAIAGVGLVTAVRWRSQIVAGLGLIGAMLVPVAVVAQGGLSVIGTSFVAFMLVATATVAIRERWNELLVVGMLAAAPQIAALVSRAEYHSHGPVRVIVLAAAFSVVYLAIGIATQLRSGSGRLGQLATGPITGAAFLAGGSAARLYATTTERGIALLVIAVGFAVVAAVLFRRLPWRNMSALVAAVAFTVGAIGFSELFSGQTLAYAWAAEAAALAWLAQRTREVRFQMWSAVYLLLALAHVVSIDAPPRILLRPGEHPLHGAAPVAAIAAVAVIFARYSSAQVLAVDSIQGFFAPYIRAFAAGRDELRATSLWTALVSATYAVSLLVLGAFSGFGWGHVTLSAFWSAIGLALLLVGLRRRSLQLGYGGIAWLAATTAIVVLHGAAVLAPTPRSASFLVLAAALLAAAFALQLLTRPSRLLQMPAAATLVSIGLAWDAVATLLPGRIAQGAALLGLAAAYAVLVAILFGRREQRDFTTLLWAIGAVLAATAAALLVSGTYLVLSWAVGGSVLAWLSLRAREQRFAVPAVGGLAAALVYALVFEAPPSDFFVARSNPATGVPALLIVAIGLVVLALHIRRTAVRRISWWSAGVVVVYAISLSILELLQRAFPGASLHTDFQRGHTAVSAFWGLLGLVLLYVGLTKWRSLRIAGFALFAVSLAKIFLYDLPSLSSITRALSFLAVGAVLLLGGFFYQRLSSNKDESELVPRVET